VTKPEHVTGRFNGHMGECVLLFTDECFFAGDPRHEQILKVLVTERYWLIERKGIDAMRSPSCLHIVLACNEEWSVPVDQDDRRYCCIEVGDARMRDRHYFALMDEQMRNGGYQALLGFLMQIDLTGFDPAAFPRTAEHAKQQANTRQGVAAFIEDICHEGRLPFSSETYPDVVVTSGRDKGKGFDHWVECQGPMSLRRLGPLKVKNALHANWDTQHWRETGGARLAGIQFPPLQDLRCKFEERFGKQEWRAANVTEWESTASIPF
jgi:hypothetical protein